MHCLVILRVVAIYCFLTVVYCLQYFGEIGPSQQFWSTSCDAKLCFKLLQQKHQFISKAVKSFDLHAIGAWFLRGTVDLWLENSSIVTEYAAPWKLRPVIKTS